MQTNPTRSPTARMSMFIDTLRLNGFAAGPRETTAALDVLARLGPAPVGSVRQALKALLTGSAEDWSRFDEIFDAHWLGRGVRRAEPDRSERSGRQRGARVPLWDRHLPAASGAGSGSVLSAADRDGATPAGDGHRRLAATDRTVLSQTDLRQLADGESLAEAERVAMRLATALRYRLSRRFVPASNGPRVDLRRSLRASLPTGGVPVDLIRRRRPDRPVRLVVLLDISGSMTVYARVFMLFVRGLVGGWADADAFLFHTRLVRITGALQERDPLRALARLSLLAQGLGGGTRIAGCLATFNDRYAKAVIDSRTVVIILSDGYDTDPPARLGAELVRLKRRTRRLIWLNPLAGWRGYEPVARGMAAALPHLDLFAPATTLDDLMGLETAFAGL